MVRNLQVSLILVAMALCFLQPAEGGFSWWTGLLGSNVKKVPCHMFGIEAPGPIDRQCDECCKRQQMIRPLRGAGVTPEGRCYCEILSGPRDKNSNPEKQ